MSFRSLSGCVMVLAGSALGQTCTPGFVAGYDYGTMAANGSSLVDAPLRVAAVFDGEIYAAGTGGMRVPEGGAYIAKFSGGRWTAVPGVSGPVWAMRVADLGKGPRLYATGTFALPGGGSRVSVGVFDGQTWSLLGTIPTGSRSILPVVTPAGPRVFIGGANFVLEWNGGNWAALPGVAVGGNGSAGASGIRALEWFDDGTGGLLYAGGAVWWDAAHTQWGLAKWNGASWVHVPGLMPIGSWAEVTGMAVHPEGGVPQLYVSGMFGPTNTQAKPLAKLVAGSWQVIPSVNPGAFGEGASTVVSIPTPDGPELYCSVGADPHQTRRVRNLRNGVLQDLPGQFSREGGGWTDARCLVAEPGTGRLVTLGCFTAVDNAPAPFAAIWNSVSWSGLENVGLGSPVGQTVVPDVVSGQRVYVGSRVFSTGGVSPSDLPSAPASMVRVSGDQPSYVMTTISPARAFTNNGSGWVQLAGVNAYSAWVVHDLGEDSAVLISEGARSVVRLIGSQVTMLGTTFPTSTAATCVTTYDLGAGPRVCVGVAVSTGAGAPQGIAVLESGQWQFATTPGSVRALLPMDVGQGSELLVACYVAAMGQTGGLFAWNGTSLRPFNTGLPSGDVTMLRTVNIGGVSQLVCAVNGALYKWTGAQWQSSPGWSVKGSLTSVGELHHPDDSTSLFVGGSFDTAGSIVASNLAELKICSGHCTSDFNQDGDFGTDQDIEAFFACLAGHCCVTCGSSDFNNDGDFGTDQDIEAFFRVLAGGAC
jgi:hypothetical protein